MWPAFSVRRLYEPGNVEGVSTVQAATAQRQERLFAGREVRAVSLSGTMSAGRREDPGSSEMA
jgi:hypothetical protein